jgi:hypothetical protein
MLREQFQKQTALIEKQTVEIEKHKVEIKNQKESYHREINYLKDKLQ